MVASMRFATLRCGAVLAAGMVTAGMAVAIELEIHSGPVVTYGGGDDRVECLVNNVDEVPVQSVRLTIYSTNFGTVRSEVSCPVLPKGADCSTSYNVPGPGIKTHLACSARGYGRWNALRGTLLRTSTEDDSVNYAVELR